MANRVREVNLSTGVITTIAGNGTQGFTGNNGLATAAELNNPHGVAVDSSGNVYIADSANNSVRKVDHSTGLITMFAGNGTAGFTGDGGPATGAELSYPWALAMDSTGHLYIADHSNSRVRCVDLSTGKITTVAGKGSGGAFGGDGGQATADVDRQSGWNCSRRQRQSLYRRHRLPADSGGQSRHGIISTVAGNGNYGYSGDGGPATAASLCKSLRSRSGRLWACFYCRHRATRAFAKWTWRPD